MTLDEEILKGLSVAVIDDHEVVLEGLRSYLSGHGVGHLDAFSRASQLLDSIRTNSYEVFVIDVELPDINVETLIDNIREGQPGARIIVNTMHEELWVVNKMAEKKVDGVVYKDGQLSQLLEAIVSVVGGQPYFCRKFQRSLEWSKLQGDVLTKREVEVVQAIAQGLPTKEIAGRLFISENTVESHRQKIMEKMRSRNVAELIVKAIAAGYIGFDLVSERD
jgi:DNA-binding NarL/FixJ family response regulator